MFKVQESYIKVGQTDVDFLYLKQHKLCQSSIYFTFRIFEIKKYPLRVSEKFLTLNWPLKPTHTLYWKVCLLCGKVNF